MTQSLECDVDLVIAHLTKLIGAENMSDDLILEELKAFYERNNLRIYLQGYGQAIVT